MMRIAPALAAAAVAIAIAVATLAWLLRPAPPAPLPAPYAVARALGAGADTAGYARAAGPRRFVCPRDHGPHPRFRTEWWYFTGNLTAGDGRRFGYQLTFFRVALRPAAVRSSSAWRARDLYMAHFALSDVDGGGLHAFERFSRGAAQLAGARGAPLHVWLEDWTAEAIAGDERALRLRAREGDVAIALDLEHGKPPVLQGEAGLSRKSDAPGNASYYYSLPRMPTRGTISVGGQTIAVTGASWLDREWSTSALGTEQIGWDWFALQLDDGRELMFYRLRRRDGRTDPLSAGTLVAADGAPRPLASADVGVATTAHWTSPVSRVRYPGGWRLTVPGAGLVLRITPVLADQELRLTVRYWEGAVDVEGTAAGRTVQGRGYVELTGYGDAGTAPRLR
ncbi:MAG: carotenoid 1,2-hydratase [Gammaproteobacteria bacterium]|nr:carotenoid 1,2-hydratase [Gammaproteobacteria bacterium]